MLVDDRGADLSGLSETAAADARTDASTSDAPGGGGDASGDAGVDGAQACTPPSFCDDFERTDLRGLWDNNTSVGSSIAIDSTKSQSGTRSLRADLTGSTAERTAYLERLLPAGTLGAKITLFFRFEAAPASTDVIIASFQLNNPTSAAHFGFYSDGLRFTASTNSQQQVSLLGAPKLGEWDKLTLEFRRSAATATPTLRVTRGLDDRRRRARALHAGHLGERPPRRLLLRRGNHHRHCLARRRRHRSRVMRSRRDRVTASSRR